MVLGRREPNSEMGQGPLVTYVNDVRAAMSEAKRAAGDKNVLVHGQGRRLFDNLRPEHIELERTRILEGEASVTHMHHRVQR